MVADRETRTVKHSTFKDLASWLPSNPLLVINNARVAPARLYGNRPTGGLVEAVILEPPPPHAPAGKYWLECLVKPANRLKNGAEVIFGPGVRAEAVRPGRPGLRVLKFTFDGLPAEALEALGRMPLPPYIKREVDNDPWADLDRERYQTVYAREPGAVAAPTAGLHFTPALLKGLAALGVETAELTLKVGYGTFAPVREQDITKHVMHGERVSVSEKLTTAVNRAKAEGRPILAVGTTVVRTLEFLGRRGMPLEPYEGQCDLFIYPGFEFRVVDKMITNFHLPGSTLIMLVAALAGRDFILEAYRQAVADRYRFFSYGDAMLIL
jgi:S-adenosylmethionine:tRNA ribosyltransferase-isomerase